MEKKKKIKLILENLFKKKFNIKKIDRMGLGEFKNWDSLKHYYLLLNIEKEFNIKFSTISFSKLKNIKQILNEIKKIEKK